MEVKMKGENLKILTRAIRLCATANTCRLSPFVRLIYRNTLTSLSHRFYPFTHTHIYIYSHTSIIFFILFFLSSALFGYWTLELTRTRPGRDVQNSTCGTMSRPLWRRWYFRKRSPPTKYTVRPPNNLEDPRREVVRSSFFMIALSLHLDPSANRCVHFPSSKTIIYPHSFYSQADKDPANRGWAWGCTCRGRSSGSSVGRRGRGCSTRIGTGAGGTANHVDFLTKRERDGREYI